MMFTEAITAVFKDNDRITRTTWHNRNVYIEMNDRKQACTTWNSETQTVDGLLHPWVMDEQDYFASDWEVVTDA